MFETDFQGSLANRHNEYIKIYKQKSEISLTRKQLDDV